MTLQSPRTQLYKPFRHPPSHSSMRSRASLALAALSLLCSAMCTNAFIMPGIVAPARSFLQVCCSLHSLPRLRTHSHPAMPPGRSTRGQRTPPARRTCYSAHLKDGQCCVSCHLHRPAVFGGEEDERRRLRKFCLGWIICCLTFLFLPTTVPIQLFPGAAHIASRQQDGLHGGAGSQASDAASIDGSASIDGG